MVMETLACAALVANSIRPAKATTSDRMFTSGLLALTAAPLSVPPHQYARNAALVPAACEPIVNVRQGANKAAAGFSRAWRIDFSRAMAGRPDSNSPPPRTHFGSSALTHHAHTAPE